MMNVPLIFYAARASGDRALDRSGPSRTAIPPRAPWSAPTARPRMKGIFDPDTGAFLRQSTHQGLRADSTWARGLAWSLYGFSTVFSLHRTRFGSDRRHAQRRLLSSPGVRRAWCLPGILTSRAGPDRIDDSSAAAIAASGLWDLAALVESREPAEAERYRNATLTILDSLCTDRYLAWTTPGWEGVLKHAVYHFHKKLGVDESVMWGDFFFLEAVA